MQRREFLAAAAPALVSTAAAVQPDFRAVQPLVGPVVDRIAADAEFRQDFIDYAHERLGTEQFVDTLSDMVADAEEVAGPAVMAPIIDRLATDPGFRLQFVNFARERLGQSRFNSTIYNLMLDAKPELRSRPLVLRMMRKLIWGGGGRRRLFGRRC